MFKCFKWLWLGSGTSHGTGDNRTQELVSGFWKLEPQTWNPENQTWNPENQTWNPENQTWNQEARSKKLEARS
jgi:hypothetical protein